MQAGHHFNTFPLMDGQVVPAGYGAELRPYWRNFFEHIPTVQVLGLAGWLAVCLSVCLDVMRGSASHLLSVAWVD